MGGVEASTENATAIPSVSQIVSMTKPTDLIVIFRQLAFAGQYLHPVAEAIASQMQAAVSICIIGPVADRNGEVEVRRYVPMVLRIDPNLMCCHSASMSIGQEDSNRPLGPCMIRLAIRKLKNQCVPMGEPISVSGSFSHHGVH
jgi:hypothetical protein